MSINKLGLENISGILSGKSSNPQEIEAKTASYTLAFTDKDRLVTMSSESDTTITIPADSSVNFLTGTKIDITNINTGTLTIAGDTGVTVNGLPLTLTQYQTTTIMKTASDTWLIRGGTGTGGGNYKSFSLFSSGM
jgi:hypothetical protein